MTKRQNRVFAVMNLPTRVPHRIVAARAILAASTGNPFLPKPNPPLGKLAAAIAALDRAEIARATRTRGTAEVRDLALSVLLALLRTLKAYVQEQADANPEKAEIIITSAGMSVRRPTTRSKAPFVATPGLSGTMNLEVKAPAKRASYQWEWRAEGAASWTPVEPTLQAKTTITRLPIGSYVELRFRVVTKAGEGDWSEPLTALVK